MAGNLPHGGGPPGAGDDFDITALPPRVRPFIPGRYAPPVHMLPRAVFCRFTEFNDRAPGDLLLREPEQHLSHDAREVFYFIFCIFRAFCSFAMLEHTVLAYDIVLCLHSEHVT